MPRPYRCPKCRGLFPSRREGLRHNIETHNDPRPFNRISETQMTRSIYGHPYKMSELVRLCGSDVLTDQQIDGWPLDADIYHGEPLRVMACPPDPGRWDVLAAALRCAKQQELLGTRSGLPNSGIQKMLGMT